MHFFQLKSGPVTCRGLHHKYEINHSSVLALEWAVWWVMLNKSVLNYYSHFSSLFPDFFSAIVFYSSRRIVSDKKNHVTLKYNMF